MSETLTQTDTPNRTERTDMPSREVDESLEVGEVDGTQLVSQSIQHIDTIQARVAETMGLSVDSPFVVEQTDEALLYVADRSRIGEELGTDSMVALRDVVIEGALGKKSAGVNPLERLEASGRRDDVTRVAAELHASHATLPNHQEAAAAIAAAIDALQSDAIMTEYEPAPGAPIDVLDQATVGVEYLESGRIDSTVRLVDEMHSAMYMSRGELSEELNAQFNTAALAINWSGLSSEDANQLVNSMASFDNTRQNLVGAESPEVQLGMTLGVLRSLVPAEVLARLYQETRPDGRSSSLNIFLHSNILTPANARFNAQVLAKIYQSSGGLDNVAVGQDSAVDDLREFIGDVDMGILSIPEKPPDQTQEAIRIHDNEVISHMMDTLGKMGVSEQGQYDYMCAASARLLSKNTGTPRYFDGLKVADRLSKIQRTIESVGVDVVERVQDKLGVINIDNYDSSDLMSLNNLLDESPSFIEHLKTGDVTVVFVDAFGDHNGAFESLLNNYRKDHGRTLMFEVGSPGDFYRRMALLKRLGVKPSTLVVAAHGSPGSTHFGGGLQGFNLLSDARIAKPGSSAESLLLDKARIDRLVSDEFMQSCRGIDSPDELTGKRQIIINSCSSDKEFADGVPTTASAVAERIGRTDTDVYGATDVMYTDPLSLDTLTFRKWSAGMDSDSQSESITSKITLDQKKTSLFGRGGLKIKRSLVSNIPLNKQTEQGDLI